MYLPFWWENLHEIKLNKQDGKLLFLKSSCGRQLSYLRPPPWRTSPGRPDVYLFERKPPKNWVPPVMSSGDHFLFRSAGCKHGCHGDVSGCHWRLSTKDLCSRAAALSGVWAGQEWSLYWSLYWEIVYWISAGLSTGKQCTGPTDFVKCQYTGLYWVYG